MAAIGLGSNSPSVAGSPRETLVAALGALSGPGLSVTAVSRFFRTPAFPPGSGPDFVNAAACIDTALTPAALLDHLHRVEARFGRERKARWAARTLDIDLLSVGDAIAPDADTLRRWMSLDPARQRQETPDRLILPHPRIQDRAFVLIPLAEIAPRWVHPLTGADIGAMLAALPEAEKAAVWPI